MDPKSLSTQKFPNAAAENAAARKASGIDGPGVDPAERDLSALSAAARYAVLAGRVAEREQVFREVIRWAHAMSGAADSMLRDAPTINRSWHEGARHMADALATWAAEALERPE